jgi:predicted NUDIX family NTP pyrophosphohydrolase
MKTAAGTLLYRKRGDAIEVLIIHASGNYNAKAPWSIPKGEVEPDEELEAAARRETLEETGVVAGTLVALGYVDLPSRSGFTVLPERRPLGARRGWHRGRSTGRSSSASTKRAAAF